jgi:hypothetical protein
VRQLQAAVVPVSAPKNSSQNGDGFRFYRWTDAVTGEETDVLSVTSIRKLCGESFNLVNWQLANLADAALGTMKRTVVGPRGGIKDKRVIEEYPSEFAVKYDEAAGDQKKIDELRKWLRESADEPRNIAAVRGTIVHEAIEKNVEWDRIERPYIEAAFANLSSRDKRKAKKGVQDEDVHFVRNAVRQYWAMRTTLPFVIIAREVQVFNLTAGYAGSFDALVWLLGKFDSQGNFIPMDVDRASLPKGRDITVETIRRHGGMLVLADWKTSKDVHTDQVVQATAYLSAEFVGSDGVIDRRLTDLLQAATTGALVHIRPNQWSFHMFDWTPEVVRAFLGSVAFARFLAKFSKPQSLFTHEFRGESEEIDEEIAA